MLGGRWRGRRGPLAYEDHGDVALVETVLERTFHNFPAPPSAGTAMAPAKSKLFVPLRLVVIAGLFSQVRVMGASSNFLSHDEMLISLALSKLWGDGPAEASASARLFLIKFEIDLNKRALGAGWAVGQGPEQLPRNSTTSRRPDPRDMCTDYGEIPLP